MTQKELYEIAGKMTGKDLAYLVGAFLKQNDEKELGMNLDAEEFTIKGVIKCTPKKEKFELKHRNFEEFRKAMREEKSFKLG